MNDYRLEYYRKAVIDLTGISLEQFVSKSRKRELVEARYAFFLIAYTNVKCSYNQMAAYAGGRDHSTAIHGILTMKDLMFSNPKRFAWVKEIIEQDMPMNMRVDYNIAKAERLCASARFSLNNKDVVGAYKALRRAINALATPELTDELLTLAADQKMFEEVNG